jgi:Uma2 family endonuclease
MTADQLLNMPKDGFRYELVRGELRKMSPAGQFHGEYAMSIGAPLAIHVKANGLGKVYAAETGFKLESDPDHVRAPDAAFISSARLKEVGESFGFVSGAPNVAIEVISPSDRYTDVEEKVADWLDAGTLAVILVDPRRRVVKVHRSSTDIAMLTVEDTLAIDDIVPRWQMPVGEIFE